MLRVVFISTYSGLCEPEKKRFRRGEEVNAYRLLGGDLSFENRKLENRTYALCLQHLCQTREIVDPGVKDRDARR